MSRIIIISYFRGYIDYISIFRITMKVYLPQYVFITTTLISIPYVRKKLRYFPFSSYQSSNPVRGQSLIDSHPWNLYQNSQW